MRGEVEEEQHRSAEEQVHSHLQAPDNPAARSIEHTAVPAMP